MKNKRFIKKHISSKFFEFPKNSFSSWLYTKKFNYVTDKISNFHSNLYLANKTSKLDKFFISRTFKFDFVFLNDEYTNQIVNKTISKKDMEELLREINILKSITVSIVIFPEEHITIFGESQHIPPSMTDFISQTKMNVRFFNLVGTYFAFPVWAPEMRPCSTRNSIQFSVSANQLEGSSEDTNTTLNRYMPSSASVYAKRYNPYINHNKRAENLETILYCCPSCKKLFSLYSEFNCVKCKECGKVVEVLENAEINLAKNIENLDDFKKYQFDVLSHQDFSIKPLVEYKNVLVCKPDIKNIKFIPIGDTDIVIYADKFTIELADNKKKTYQISKIEKINLEYNNVVRIKFKNDELILRGDHKENFYILFDLIKIVK